MSKRTFNLIVGIAGGVQAIACAIADTKTALTDVHGTECEVYARIVGYYRAIKNWNKGKADEYKIRKMFDALPNVRYADNGGYSRDKETARAHSTEEIDEVLGAKKEAA